jgi:hypothetical protein
LSKKWIHKEPRSRSENKRTEELKMLDNALFIFTGWARPQSMKNSTAGQMDNRACLSMHKK